MRRLTVIDTFCGAGGFSEGFRQAGFDVVLGIDNWKPARDTFEANGLGESTNIDMFELVGDGGYERAKELVREIEAKHGRIDVLVGSPPCTEFSYAKKGGKGDLEKGMLLVRAHLVLAAALRPRFWLMENVPRLKVAIREESDGWDRDGYAVPLSKLGINEKIAGTPWIHDEHLHVPFGDVHVASDFGAPQRRRRFLAGNVPLELIDEMQAPERTMDDCLSALRESVDAGGSRVRDPNYRHHTVARSRVRDHFYDTTLHPMYWEEMRHLKRRHIHYGRMAFPDELDRPGRTIMATFNPSSREAVLMDTGRWTIYQGKRRPLYRQPTVREVACLQGFPLDFQLVAGSLSGRYKLVGNAVPCQMSYALARGVLRAFEEHGCEDRAQRRRYRATLASIEAGKKRGKRVPLIVHQTDDPGEAPDFGKQNLREFRSRPHKHIRRKLLSSKPFQSSSVVVFENTAWTPEGKRIGGEWKACIQKGTGTRFSQVYLDDCSVPSLLDALDGYSSEVAADGKSQMVLEGIGAAADRAGWRVDRVLRPILSSIEAGIPIVNSGWVEFPGYDAPDVRRHLRFVSSARLPVPTSGQMQRFFTGHHFQTEGAIGPIELFDGLDAILLECLTDEDARWVLSARVSLKTVRDRGAELHGGRASRYAVGEVEGDVPLITVLAALAATRVLALMHRDAEPEGGALVDSLRAADRALSAWATQRTRHSRHA